MKIKLYHRIGPNGEDSAAVRQFLVEHQLSEFVEFFNVNYPNSLAQLQSLTGTSEAPVLVVDETPYSGRETILDWLRVNLLRQAD